MENDFYNSLASYLKAHDTQSANRVIMEELGRILVKDRANFVTLLKFSSLPASEQMSDAELIDLFIYHCHNRNLMVGAAFLVNQHNKKAGFDGEDEISDTGVKLVHKVMYNNFDAFENDIESLEYSNAGGAWAGAIDSIAKLGGKGLEFQQKKKFGTSDALTKKIDAKNAMVASVLEQRKAQQVAAQEAAAHKAKQNKILLIAGASLLGLTIIIGGIVIYVKRKK